MSDGAIAGLIFFGIILIGMVKLALEGKPTARDRHRRRFDR